MWQTETPPSESGPMHALLPPAATERSLPASGTVQRLGLGLGCCSFRDFGEASASLENPLGESAPRPSLEKMGWEENEEIGARTRNED